MNNLNENIDINYTRLLAKILIQIQKPFWDKNVYYKFLCLSIPYEDFINFVIFCKDKSWDYTRTICNHYYDCNQYVYCISYKELLELFPYESLDDIVVIEKICQQVIHEQPQTVKDFKKGKTNAINRLKGQVMKITQGKIDVNMVDSTLTRLLSV